MASHEDAFEPGSAGGQSGEDVIERSQLPDSALAPPPRILVIDEDEDSAAEISSALGTLCAVVVAHAPEAALEAIVEARFDLVICVSPMAGYDGLEVLDDLYLAMPGQPTVLVADDLAAFDRDTMGARVDAVVRRTPLDAALLTETVRPFLDGVGRDRAWAARRRQNDAILSNLDEGVTLVSASGRIIEVNARSAETFGMPAERFRFRNLRTAPSERRDEEGRLRGPDEHPFALALASRRTVTSVDEVRRGVDGAIRFLETTARPLIAAGEERPYGVALSFRDVTDTRLAEVERRSAERRERAIYEYASEGYVVVDRSGRVIEASSTIERLVAETDVVGADALDLVHVSDRDACREIFRAVRDRPMGPVHAEIRAAVATEDPTWVEATFSNRIDDDSIGGIVINLRDITERKHAEESMARLSQIVESSADSIIAETLGGVVTAWNPASEQLYGYRADEAIGRLTTDLIVPPDRRDEIDELRGAIRRGEKVELRDTWRRRRNATTVAVSIIVSPVHDAAGTLIGASTIARDVTARRRLEAERRSAEDRFRLGFERGAIGMAMIGLDLRVVRANDALARLVGSSVTALAGRDILDLVHHEDTAHAHDQIAALLNGQDSFRGDLRLVGAEGATVWVVLDVVLVRDDAGLPFYLFAQIQDITARKLSEEALTHQALHDALTGLPNRTLLYDRLGHAFERCASTGTETAVVFVDIDRLKLVNDSLGHRAGDELLIAVAGRLATGLSSSDTVARFGGDEFVVVREDVAVNEVALFGNEVVNLLRGPFKVAGTEVRLTASAGVVLGGRGASAEESLRDADAAMYRAKRRGGDRAEIFDESLGREVTARFDLEQALSVALDRGEMRVVYQPVLDIASAALVGVEALVRWDNPDRGELGPAEFIELAEETGHIGRIGAFVLSESLRETMAWRSEIADASDLFCSVNISSRELATGDVVERVATALSDHHTPANALRLGLTESAVMANVEQTMEQLRSLRALGVKIEIDDFGTGHSSLSYLSRLPVSALKIDRAFVSALGGGAEDAAIVQAIISIGKTLRLELCAGGVETEVQRRILSELGCDRAQGYLFAAPMDAATFVSWARSRRYRRVG